MYREHDFVCSIVCRIKKEESRSLSCIYMEIITLIFISFSTFTTNGNWLHEVLNYKIFFIHKYLPVRLAGFCHIHMLINTDSSFILTLLIKFQFLCFCNALQITWHNSSSNNNQLIGYYGKSNYFDNKFDHSFYILFWFNTP